MTDLKVRAQTALILMAIFLVCLSFGKNTLSVFMFMVGALSCKEMFNVVSAIKQFSKVLNVILLSGLSLIFYYEGVASLLQYDDFVYFIVIIMASVVAADTGAYFVGKNLGKTFTMKLASGISPNKTLAGAFGGILSGGLVFTLLSMILFDLSLLELFLGGCLLVVASIAGDLLQSYCKRQAGMSDSGVLLDGHGGVWDRFDSHKLAIPVFAYMLSVLLV